MKYAVVHAGKAHRDEVLAVGLAIYAGLITLTTKVVRRDPTAEEIEDPKVLVLDVGERHDPVRMCFDHHGRALPEGSKDCALSLLARHLKVKGREPLTFHELWVDRPWYQFTVGMDVSGPYAMAKEYGADKLPPGSPFEWTILDAVRNSKEFDEVVKLAAFQTIGGRVEDALKLRDRPAWLQQNTKVEEINGVNIIILESDDITGLEDHRDLLMERDGLEIAVSVTHDDPDRGDGLALYRFADHPRVNFSKVDGDPEVLFAHQAGFIAKTFKRDLDIARDLIRRSLV
jgi:hypothetical protein